MFNKIFFYSVFIFLIILIFRLVISDTGIFFAYDYLKNKININNTSNQESINALSTQTDREYLFQNIEGFKKKFNNNLIPLKPHLDQLI